MAKGKKTGGGSRKGIPNVVTADLKAAILEAARLVGDKQAGDDPRQPGGVLSYLMGIAEGAPVAFVGLLGKVLPMTVAGDPDNPLVPTVIGARALTPAEWERQAQAVQQKVGGGG